MKLLVSLTVAGVAATIAAAPGGDAAAPATRVGPALESLGALAFGPPGVLYAADQQAATIYALQLPAPSGAKGTAAVEKLDEKVAAMLGTGASEIRIADLAVDPRSGNSFLAVMRGSGSDSKPVLMRLDGAGTLAIVPMETIAYTSVAIPNAPTAAPESSRNPRAQSVTDMAYQDGRLYVAGLSNEEFASKLWSFSYPFASADRGTSVEIFHGNHGRLETRSPVYTFVPYTVAGTPSLIAGYLCTPLVKFPVSALSPGAKITGTTIAELGAGNRPIDMILYQQGGKDYLLMSNTSRGVMKIPTADFASQPGITERVPTGTAGVQYETVATLTGVQQLDKLDASRAVVIAKSEAGPLSLRVVALP